MNTQLSVRKKPGLFPYILLTLTLALFSFNSQAGGDMKGKHSWMKSHGQDIVDIASDAGQFNTLIAAVKEAGLVETLKGEGPFTVFAPTDAAFAKLPKEKLNALLQDKEKLASILTYHVVPGQIMASEVKQISSAKTVQGQSIAIDSAMGVKVDNANVIKTDIMASNGVIHVIDSVIVPN